MNSLNFTKRYLVCAVTKQHKFVLFDEKDTGKEALASARKLASKPWKYNTDMIIVYDYNYNHAIAGFNEKGLVKDNYKISLYNKLWCHVSGWPTKLESQGEKNMEIKEQDKIIGIYNFGYPLKGEYVLSKGTDLRLKDEKPFYGPDGKISLVVHPNKILSDYASTYIEAFPYVEAFIELKDGGKEVSDSLLLIANDAEGNTSEDRLWLSETSRKNSLNLLKEQIKLVGFNSLEEMQADYASYVKKISDKDLPSKISLKPIKNTSIEKDVNERE